jgi:hypothetical protein
MAKRTDGKCPDCEKKIRGYGFYVGLAFPYGATLQNAKGLSPESVYKVKCKACATEHYRQLG